MGLSNAQYDDIMRQYEKRQEKSRTQAEKRLAYVYENIEGFKELDLDIAAISVTQAKKYLNGDENAIALSKDLLNEKSKTKERLLINAGLNPDYLKPEYECPACHDTGYIERGKCQCLKQAIIDLLYEQSGIKEMLNQENFSQLDYRYYEGEDLKRFSKAVDKCRQFCEKSDYQNLFFYGTVGTGKSFLSSCVAKSLLDKGFSVIYYTATEFFKALSRQIFDRDYKDDHIHTCDLLIIDDLGTETNSEFLNSQLFSCLNTRHLNQKSTIISTNLLLEELSKRYTDRIFSRIISNYELLLLSGADIRMIKKLKKVERISFQTMEGA
ncbi:MAG: ATP-binding protein [Lachnospiraceae bacterium]|nr:ATP-binding protein [Lachnospiraceae bacterium]